MKEKSNKCNKKKTTYFILKSTKLQNKKVTK